RDVQQLLQPDPGADRPVAEQGQVREGGLPPAEEAGRGSGAPAPGEDRGQADEADPGPGRLPGRAGRRPVQAGALPLLTCPPGRNTERAPRGARFRLRAAQTMRWAAAISSGVAVVFITIERIASETPVSGTRSDRRRKVSRLS